MMRLESILAETKMQPRPYQHRIIRKVTDMFLGKHVMGDGSTQAASKSVMIESPTGSGKTCVGLAVIKVLQLLDPDLAIGWYAMRRNLLAQAENEMMKLGCPLNRISFISMFDKYPEQLMQWKHEGRRVLIATDECLVGETLVHTLVDGKPVLVPIEEIVNNGVGEAVLSYNQEADRLEWQPIVSRTCTGEKDVFEVEIETEDGDVVTVVATANHRFFTGGEYKRLDELAVGSEVYVKHGEEPENQQETHHELPTAALSGANGN